MTLRGSDLQSDSDLDSIRNSCDVFFVLCHKMPVSTAGAPVLPLLMLEQHSTLSFWNRLTNESQDLQRYSFCSISQNAFLLI